MGVRDGVADQPTGDTDGDPELDAAILAHDRAREGYIYRRLEIRRRMAVAAFLLMIVGNPALIIAGLSADNIANRIAVLATVIATFNVSLAGIVAAYWGVGSFDTRTMYGGGGMYGGGYGGASYGRAPMLTSSAPLKTSRAD